MKTASFDRRAYKQRAVVLAIVMVVATAYWYEWLFRDGGLLAPVLASLVGTLFIVFSEFRLPLLLLALRVIVALGLVGLTRALFTKEPVLPGLIVLVVTICVLLFLERWQRSSAKLVEDDRLGEHVGVTELDLRSQDPKDGKKPQSS